MDPGNSGTHGTTEPPHPLTPLKPRYHPMPGWNPRPQTDHSTPSNSLRQANNDQATGSPLTPLFLLATIVILLPTLYTAWNMALTPNPLDNKGYQILQTDLEQRLQTIDNLCCPSDPTSPSLLHEWATQAWANNPDPLEENITSLLSQPEATRLNLQLTTGPHTYPAYQPTEPAGAAVGTQLWIKPTSLGPGYLIPRLENTTGQAPIDVHHLPLDANAYRTPRHSPTNTTLTTHIEHTRTLQSETGETTVNKTHHSQLAGPPMPAITMYFEEPDWETMLSQGIPIGAPDPAATPTYTQVLTKDDLTAERIIRAQENLTEPDDDVYPHHAFNLTIDLHGPGNITRTGVDAALEGTNTTVDDAYELTITIPRRWTEARIDDDDQDANDDAGWHSVEMQRAPGQTTITAILPLEAAYTLHPPNSYTPAAYALMSGTTINAPFHFHARPPADSAQSELGFQTITARLQSLTWRLNQQATLTIELANEPGRVHRTLTTNAPTAIPPTPMLDPDTPKAIPLPFGAVLANGGEATTIREITWTLPPGTLQTGTGAITVLEDFSDAGEDAWSIEDEGATLKWRPDLDAPCPELAACAIAASVQTTGNTLPSATHHRTPITTSLYDPPAIDDYIQWFIHNDHAYNGAPLDEVEIAQTRLAHQFTTQHPGTQPTTKLWTIPPTTDPICTQDDIDERTQTSPNRHNDTVNYNWTPVEDGYPRLGSATECVTGRDWTTRSFPLLAQTGTRLGPTSLARATTNIHPNLPADALSAWNNGLAGSSLTPFTHSTPAGTTITLQAVLDSLYDSLLANGVGQATLRYEVLDPHNAWEHHPWKTGLIAKDVDIAITSQAECPALETNEPNPPKLDEECETIEDEGDEWIERSDPFPSRFLLKIDLPTSTIPGTHMIILEVSWQALTSGGATFTETGRLIAPIDVLSPAGDRVHLTLLGATAWMRDWG